MDEQVIHLLELINANLVRLIELQGHRNHNVVIRTTGPLHCDDPIVEALQDDKLWKEQTR